MSVDVSDPEDVHVEKLYRVRMQKDLERTRIYQQVYARLVSKIKQSNDMDYTDLLFTMEPFILGSPLYNMKCCIAFMMYKCRKNGMVAKYIYPNVLFVSWRVAVDNTTTSGSAVPGKRVSNRQHSIIQDISMSVSEASDTEDLELERLIASKKLR